MLAKTIIQNEDGILDGFSHHKIPMLCYTRKRARNYLLFPHYKKLFLFGILLFLRTSISDFFKKVQKTFPLSVNNCFFPGNCKEILGAAHPVSFKQTFFLVEKLIFSKKCQNIFCGGGGAGVVDEMFLDIFFGVHLRAVHFRLMVSRI